tara:strand:- start:661 stop:2991 length:2331 start_codon:yes stop_codon:yes gene_type:complete
MELKFNSEKNNVSNNIMIANQKPDKIKFTDKVNVRKAKYLFSQNLNTFKTLFWNSTEVSQTGRKCEIGVYFNLVKKFCSLIISKQIDNQEYALIEQKYKYASGCKSGRLYVDGFGVQSLQGNLRKFLTGDYLLDIDIKNAHPNILFDMIQNFNQSKSESEKIDDCYLRMYIKNRTKILNSNKFNKIDLLICLNSDTIVDVKKKGCFHTKNDFLINFHKEKMIAFEILMNKSDLIKKYKIKTTNDENPISSCINKLFCVFENQLIQNEIKSDICVPMFDGFMFDESEKDKYDYLLDYKDTIQWSYKSNNTEFEINLDDFDDTKCLDYQSVKKEFEKKHCMIANPCIFVRTCMNEDYDMIDQLFNLSDFSTNTAIYEYISVDKNGKKVNFLSDWLKDENKRYFEGISFNPYSLKENDNTGKHIFNLFTPFKCERVEGEFEKPDWFLDFLFDNIANEEEKSFDWLLKYCAHFFQKPDENIELVPVLRGESGIGKDTFIEILESMMGKLNDYVHRTADLNEIFPKSGGFNGALKNKLLVQFNEAESIDGIECKEKIKNQATAKYNTINSKYMALMKQKNRAQIIFCSNNNSPVQFSFDERRFLMFMCGVKHKNCKKYWDFIYSMIDNPQKLDELFTYLLSIDISDWKPFEERPKTRAYNIALANSIPHYVNFLRQAFEQDKIFKKTNNGYLYISSTKLFDEYKMYLTFNCLMKVDNFKSTTFKTQLQEYKSIQFDKRVIINKHQLRMVLINKDNLITEFIKYGEKNIDGEDEEFVNIEDL